MAWTRWQVAGPPPYFESAAHFEDLVGRLITCETLLGRSGVHWDIRPSHHVPTLEVRVVDAASRPDDTLLLAAAVKGLALAALTAVRQGQAAPRPEPEMPRAGYWRAACDGVRGQSVDLRSGRLRPTTQALVRLWETALPALATQDLALADAARHRLTREGNGADRQRAAYRRRHRLNDVVDHLVHQVTG
ncbi:glutamate-cysteine ligase family protein [Streptomyces sp. NPDC049813]|uniref:carboxylate-amine ligase n=1 Tax=Streptomyces sp. NPDC049813 TaxID=3365597 RepID=UPI0037A7EC37